MDIIEVLKEAREALNRATDLLWEHCEGIAPRIKPLDQTLARIDAALSEIERPASVGDAEMLKGRVKLTMDGNCGCALLGSNIQEGEAEFVCVDDAPERYSSMVYREKWAMTQAYRNLCQRLGTQFPYYFDSENPSAALQRPAAQAVPEGMVLVPQVATIEMLAAFHDEKYPGLSSVITMQRAYKAMLKAAASQQGETND